METAVNIDLGRIIKTDKHNIVIGASITAMNSKIISGLMKDADILKAKHTDASKAELIEKINSERNGFDVYFTNDSLVTRELSTDDFSKIKKMDYRFGKDGIANNAAPYIPKTIMNFSINYSFKGLNIGVNYNMVGAQYTDYLNFENETSEGGVGKLKEFSTVDANISYSFAGSKNKFVQGITIFAAGKNLTNDVYQASRLHRISSGIMPGGIRQINGGIRINI